MTLRVTQGDESLACGAANSGRSHPFKGGLLLRRGFAAPTVEAFNRAHAPQAHRRLLALRRTLLRRRHSRRQFHNPYIPEVDLSAFRFHADISLLLRSLPDAVHEFAVHRQLEHAVDGYHVIGIPLAPALTPIFDRHTAHAARIIRNRLRL